MTNAAISADRKMRMELPAYGITHYENYQAIHQYLSVIVDISASMNDTEEGESKRNIQLAEDLIRQIGRGEDLPDEYKETTDIQFFTFNNKVESVFGPAPLSQYNGSIELSASGTTSFYSAVIHAIENARTVQANYRRVGISYRRTHIFIFTDGYPTDKEYCSRAQQLCRENAVVLHVILLPGGDPKAVLALTQGQGTCKAKVCLYKVTDCKNGLPEAASFIQATVIAFSESAPHEQVALELPPHLLTTEPVVRDEEGRGEMYQESVVVFH